MEEKKSGWRQGKAAKLVGSWLNHCISCKWPLKHLKLSCLSSLNGTKLIKAAMCILCFNFSKISLLDFSINWPSISILQIAQCSLYPPLWFGHVISSNYQQKWSFDFEFWGYTLFFLHCHCSISFFHSSSFYFLKIQNFCPIFLIITNLAQTSFLFKISSTTQI